MRLGTVHLQTEGWPRLRRELAEAEQAGVDVLYVADHLTHPRLPDVFLAEGWTTLAAAATVVETADLGVLVASSSFRGALELARAAATVQDLADGRFVFGLGAGSPVDALAATGHEPTPAELSSRFASTVADIDRILRGEQPDVYNLPLPPGRDRPFLMLAAHGRRGLDLVARHADGWSTYGGPASVTLEARDYWALLAQQNRELDGACARADRDATGLRRSLLLGFGTVRPTASVATFRECWDRAEQCGFDELVVYWPREAMGVTDTATFRACLRTVR